MAWDIAWGVPGIRKRFARYSVTAAGSGVIKSIPRTAQAFFPKRKSPSGDAFAASRRCTILRRLYISPAMKTTLLRLLTSTAAVAFLISTAAPVRAQDDKDDGQKEEESAEGEEDEEAPPEFDAEEFKKKNKEETRKNEAEIRKMLKVFKTLDGEWTGTEKIEHADEQFKALDQQWKDVWKGFYTMDGRYFEMTGKTEGENNSIYRWVCTWVPSDEAYKAWYFGENGQTLYTGELSSDGKYVIWTVENEDETTQTKFSMIADGDRVTCSGTDRIGGRVFSRQSSSYTRKKVEL
jgi:hypothetical protein